MKDPAELIKLWVNHKPQLGGGYGKAKSSDGVCWCKAAPPEAALSSTIQFDVKVADNYPPSR